MARRHYEFGTTPYEEDCVQVRRGEDYMPSMRVEARRMLNICHKLWPGMEFKIVTNPHNLGDYLSIRLYFDDTDEKAWDRVNQIETEWPLTWDECNQRIAQLTEKDETI